MNPDMASMICESWIFLAAFGSTSLTSCSEAFICATEYAGTRCL